MSLKHLIAAKNLRNKNDKPEEILQREVRKYISLKYPGAFVIVNPYAGAKQSKRAAGRAKSQGLVRGIPDLLILHSGKFLGLELKADGNPAFCKNGELRKDVHLEIQYAVHKQIRAAGHHAEFACGMAEAIAILTRVFG